MGSGSDRELIARVIASDDVFARRQLSLSNNLFEDELIALGHDKDRQVREDVASKKIPPSLLLELLQDSAPTVRASALANELTDFQSFKDALLGNSFRLGPTHKRVLCNSVHVVKDSELFSSLWAVKNYDYLLMYALDRAVFDKRLDIDPEVFRFVEQNILMASDLARERYAYRLVKWSSPELLDALKDDPYRPVINALAANKRAWVSTHEYLAKKHKTPKIRISIAEVTESNELLNQIYNGTKSEAIQAAFRRNPFFSPQ